MERQTVAKVQRSAGRSKDHTLSRPSATARPPEHPILGLQRTIGNQSVQRLLSSSYIQAKLKVSQPGDKFEQEADRTADTVMRAPVSVGPVAPALSISRVADTHAQRAEEEEEDKTVQRASRSPLQHNQPDEELEESRSPLAQRKEAPEEEESLQRQESEEDESLQRQAEERDEEKPDQVVSRQEQENTEEEPLSRKEEETEELQREEGPKEEEESLQRKESEEEEPEPLQRQEEEEKVPTVQRAESKEDDEQVMTARDSSKAPAVPQGFTSLMRQSSGEGSPVPEDTRSFFESRFGADFSSVRIHTGTNATKLNKAIQAKAFTRANHIYMADGAYDPSSSGGKTLLAHELTHVVQQGYAQSSTPGQSPASLHGTSSAGPLQRQEADAESDDTPTEEQKAAALAAAARAEKLADQAVDFGKSEVAKSKEQKEKEKEAEQEARQEVRTAGGQAREAEAKGKKRKKPAGAGAEAMPVAEPQETEEGAEGAAGEKKAPASPEEDPAFQNVVKKIGGVAKKQKAHAPPQTKAAEAQAAAVAPPAEITGRAENTHAGEMEKAETPPFDAATFKKQLLKRIEELAPKTVEEADDFKDNAKLNGVKSQMSGTVEQGKAGSRGPLEAKKNEGPDPKSVEPKPVTPIPDPMPGPPPPGVGAAEAAPKPKTEGEVEAPIQENTKRIGDEMATEGVTEEQLAKSNEPQFQEALASKGEAEAHAAESPTEYRQAEQAQLGQAEGVAAATAASRTKSMHTGRAAAFGQLHEMQGQTKDKDEVARLAVGERINGIYEKSRIEVERILSELDGKVETAFDEGAEAAKKAFEDYVDAQMEAYKERRYGGWFGWARWAKDKLAGMPDEVNVFYERGRNLYVRKMDAVLDNVISIIAAELTAAKAEIAKARKEISEYLAELPASLQTVGAEAAEEAAMKLEALEGNVNSKQEELIDKLANEYQKRLKVVDERIEELKAANRGLVDKAIDAIKSVINTIIELKNMLFRVLAKIADLVMDIIADPIGFFKKMVAAVKLGLDNFIGNIDKHLEAGFIKWLTGAMGSIQLQMPEDVFSLKGIFSIIVQVLGLSWEYIRGKAVKLLGEPVVKALEGSFEIFQILMKDGLSGLWEYAQQQFSDLKEMVIEQIKSMFITQVIKAGIKWLLSLLNPVAAFIKAAIAIYDLVMFFVQKAKQIIELIEAFIDAVAEVAKGGISSAAKMIEGAFAKAIPLVIGLLASLLGISGLADKVQRLFKSVGKRVDKFIDGLLLKAKKFAGKVMKKLSPDRKDERTASEKVSDLKLATADARKVLKESDATPESIRKALPKIKKKYRLTQISLVSAGAAKFHIELAINPESKTEDEELSTKKDIFSEAAKENALKQLKLITKPEQVNPALVELERIEPGILERYKYGIKAGVVDPKEDSYVKYLSGLKEGDIFDAPLTYLKRRASFKRGKATEKNWGKVVFPDAKHKAYKILWAGNMETVIPDLVTSDVIADVKNVKSQDFDPQLRAFEMIAHPSKHPGKVFEADGTTPVTVDKSFELVVRGPKHSEGPTKVYGPLLAALNKPPHAIIHDKAEEDNKPEEKK